MSYTSKVESMKSSQLGRKERRKALRKEKKIRKAFEYAKKKNTNKICINKEELSNLSKLKHFKSSNASIDSNSQICSNVGTEFSKVKNTKSVSKKRQKNKSSNNSIQGKEKCLESEKSDDGFEVLASTNARLARLQEYVNQEIQKGKSDVPKNLKESIKKQKDDNTRKGKLIKDKHELESLHVGAQNDQKEINKLARSLKLNKHQKGKICPFYADDFGDILNDIETGRLPSSSERSTVYDSDENFEKDFLLALGKKKFNKSKSKYDTSLESCATTKDYSKGIAYGDCKSISFEDSFNNESCIDSGEDSEDHVDLLDDEAIEDDCEMVDEGGDENNEEEEVIFEGSSRLKSSSHPMASVTINSIFDAYSSESDELDQDLDGFVVDNDFVEYESDASGEDIDDPHKEKSNLSKKKLLNKESKYKRVSIEEESDRDDFVEEISPFKKNMKTLGKNVKFKKRILSEESEIEEEENPRMRYSSPDELDSSKSSKKSKITEQTTSESAPKDKKIKLKNTLGSKSVVNAAEDKLKNNSEDKSVTNKNGKLRNEGKKGIIGKEKKLKNRNDEGNLQKKKKRKLKGRNKDECTPTEKKKKKLKCKSEDVDNDIGGEEPSIKRDINKSSVNDNLKNSNKSKEVIESDNKKVAFNSRLSSNNISNKNSSEKAKKRVSFSLSDNEIHEYEGAPDGDTDYKGISDNEVELETLSDDESDLEDTFGDEIDSEDLTDNEVDFDDTADDEVYREDIYGRLRDKKGNIISPEENSGSVKYIPPAMRKLMALNQSEEKKEQLRNLKRNLKGLLNRLAESNIAGIINQIESLYHTNSNHDMNETLSQLFFDALVSPVLTPERFIQEHALLIAVLSANVGLEVGAYMLTEFVLKWMEIFEGKPEESAVESKLLDNLILVICHLYNFKIVDATLIYDIISKILEKPLHEKEVDLILLVLRSVGFRLRKDDPLSLKSVISKIQNQASAVESSSKTENLTRVRFMLEILTAIRNNNVAKVPQYDPSHVLHLKVIMKGLIRKGCRAPDLKIGLSDLLKSKVVGKWWVVGSAWSGGLKERSCDDENTLGTITNKKSDLSEQFSAKFQLKAKKLHMNRYPRINIFYALTEGSDSFDESAEKLLELRLPESQEKEIFDVMIYILVRCIEYTEFYHLVALKLCQAKKKLKRPLKFALWDKFKEIENTKMKYASNLAKFVTFIISEDCLDLSTLKAIDFTEANARTISFLRQVVMGILMNPTGAYTVSRTFNSICVNPKFKAFRQYIRLFIIKFINPKKDGNSDMKLLRTRVKMVLGILDSVGGVKL